MKIRFIGATETVTGSKFEVSHRGCVFLVDCGLYQGPREYRELNWQSIPNASRYEAVILTHAHIDHCGYIPKLWQDGFHRRIHCTAATHELCKILLTDAAKLQEEDAEFANRTRHSRHFPAEPLYTVGDAQEALRLFESHPYNEWIKLSEHVGYRFVRSGHILGAASVQIQYTEEGGSKIVTFSGDLGAGRSQVIKDPDQIFETDYLISESTYGDRTLKPLDPNELAELIMRVYKRQGTLIIPAFSVGRTQEILYLIKKLQSEEKISKNIPVYLDSPMATQASKVYGRFPQELKIFDEGYLQNAESFFLPTNFRICESPDESMLLCMSDAPKIVLSASGMLQGGRVLHHLKAKLPDARNAVLFTGYQGAGTKGLLLKTGLNKIRIHHRQVDVEAEIVTLDSISAHADSNELMKWYGQFVRAPNIIFLVHGELNSILALKYRIVNELGWDCIVPKAGEEYDLSKLSGDQNLS